MDLMRLQHAMLTQDFMYIHCCAFMMHVKRYVNESATMTSLLRVFHMKTAPDFRKALIGCQRSQAGLEISATRCHAKPHVRQRSAIMSETSLHSSASVVMIVFGMSEFARK